MARSVGSLPRSDMSGVGGNVLQNYFELPSEEVFFKIARRCGILIQETARSDSILARFRLSHCSWASFATQSGVKPKCQDSPTDAIDPIRTSGGPRTALDSPARLDNHK